MKFKLDLGTWVVIIFWFVSAYMCKGSLKGAVEDVFGTIALACIPFGLFWFALEFKSGATKK